MSITDPWAAVETEPAPEAPEQKAVGTMTVDVKPNILAAESEPAITTTYKGGTGFDAPWVVTRAASVKEADALLDAEFKAYLDKVKLVASHFAGATNSAPQGGNTTQRSAPPQGATEAPAWAAPKPFDDFVYKTGVSAKNGKTWHAWMPPTKDDQRAAKFFYPPN